MPPSTALVKGALNIGLNRNEGPNVIVAPFAPPTLPPVLGLAPSSGKQANPLGTQHALVGSLTDHTSWVPTELSTDSPSDGSETSTGDSASYVSCSSIPRKS